MNTNIKDAVPGDPILAATFNQGNDILRSVRTITGSDGITVAQTESGTSISVAQPNRFLDTLLVKLVSQGPNGESDFTDARYWGHIEYLAGSNPNDAITLKDDVPPTVADGSPQYPAIIVCTNLGELGASGTGGSHGLSTSGSVYVRVFGVYDRGDPRSKHYEFGQSSAGLFPVNLTQSGGSNGSAGAVATYTYNATDARTGATISGGPFSVTWARRAGPVTAATHGHGYYDSSGTFVLDTCDEQINLKAC